MLVLVEATTKVLVEAAAKVLVEVEAAAKVLVEAAAKGALLAMEITPAKGTSKYLILAVLQLKETTRYPSV